MGVPPSEGALLPLSPPGMPTGRLLAPERSSESPVRRSAMLLSAAAEGDVPGEPKHGGRPVSVLTTGCRPSPPCLTAREGR